MLLLPAGLAMVVFHVCPSVCLQDNAKKLWTNFNEFFFGQMGYVTSNISIDFCDNPDHDSDRKIFTKKFLPLRDGADGANSTNFAVTQEAVDELLRNFPRSGMLHWEHRPFEFGASKQASIFICHSVKNIQ